MHLEELAKVSRIIRICAQYKIDYVAAEWRFF